MNPWFEQEFGKRVKERLDNRTELVLKGRMPSWEEYIKNTQYMLGLREALEIFEDLINQMEQME